MNSDYQSGAGEPQIFIKRASSPDYAEVTDCSLYAMEQLKQEITFTIHSVYRKTINIVCTGEGLHGLLALQAKDSPQSPVSLILDVTASELASLPAEKGDFVLYRKRQLFFMKRCPEGSLPGKDLYELYFQVDLRHAAVVDMELKVPATSEASKTGCKENISSCNHFRSSLNTSLLYRIIQSSETSGFDLIFSNSPKLSDNLIMNAASIRIKEVIKLLENKQYSEAAESLGRLIGLGIGLTPSGDDFTTGVLAGIRLKELENHPFSVRYSEYVSGHRTDTNDVSRTFIECALKAQFSCAVNSLTQVPLPSEDEIREKFLAIGHSSGIDTLCGIYFVLKYL